MRALDVIVAKRDGHRLSDDQIDWFVSTYAGTDTIADEQAAALIMAIFLNGLDDDEIARWTGAMIDSGDRLDLSAIDRPTVDKHSTGGVGDKLSLIVVPLLAACGAAVPQLSGRGLGHTGGTLDKMEAIPGWQAHLSLDRMRHQLNTIGGVIAGASETLAPADRKLYALRDVTGTIESIPLIASSIMSKKIAEGTRALTLDVKVGSGAFMADLPSADALARAMVRIGDAHGVATSAIVSRMDDVLGSAVGNALEVAEAIEVLQGGGPADVIELSLALAEDMLRHTGLTADLPAVLASGEAMETFAAMVAAQGGDLAAGLPVAPHRRPIVAPTSGFVGAVRARQVGVAAWHLGAGRARKEDPVSATAGIVCLVKPGEAVEAGQPVLEVHADDEARLDRAEIELDGAVVIAADPPALTPIVVETVGG